MLVTENISIYGMTASWVSKIKNRWYLLVDLAVSDLNVQLIVCILNKVWIQVTKRPLHRSISSWSKYEHVHIAMTLSCQGALSGFTTKFPWKLALVQVSCTKIRWYRRWLKMEASTCLFPRHLNTQCQRLYHITSYIILTRAIFDMSKCIVHNGRVVLEKDDT